MYSPVLSSDDGCNHHAGNHHAGHHPHQIGSLIRLLSHQIDGHETGDFPPLQWPMPCKLYYDMSFAEEFWPIDNVESYTIALLATFFRVESTGNHIGTTLLLDRRLYTFDDGCSPIEG